MALSSGIIFGIFAMLSFGLTDFLAKIAVDRIGAAKSFLYAYLIGTLPLAIAFMIFPKMPVFDKKLILLLAIGAVFNLIGYLTMLRSFEIERLSSVYPVITMYPLVVMALGILILNERLSLIQGMGVTAALIGLFLLSIGRNEGASNKNALSMAFFSMITWGISVFMIGYIVKLSNWFFASVSFRLFTLIYVPIFIKIRRIDVSMPKTRNILPVLLLLGIADVTGGVMLNLGVSTEAVSLIGPIAALSPAVVILLASIVLKEKISNLQKLGIAGILSGLFIIAL